ERDADRRGHRRARRASAVGRVRRAPRACLRGRHHRGRAARPPRPKLRGRRGGERARRNRRGGAMTEYGRGVDAPERGFRIGVMLPNHDASGRTLGLAEVAAYAARAERLGFDSVWASDHFHGDDRAPGGAGGRYDPLLALAHLAAHTTSITL